MARISLSRQLIGAAHPGLTRGLGEFAGGQDAAGGISPGRTAAAIGLGAGEGRSSVVALTALAVTAFTDRRVLVMDTVTARDAPPSAGHSSVTELLGGDRDGGRLPDLLGGPIGRPLTRAAIRAAGTPGAVLPVLGFPWDATAVTPQMFDRALAAVRYRADLVLLDTPAASTGAPVLHAVLRSVGHLLLVVRADEDAERRVDALLDWVARAPGVPVSHQMSVVLVEHRRHTRWRPVDLPWVVVRRSRALRRGHPIAAGRPAMTSGLDIAAGVVPAGPGRPAG